MHFRHFNLLGAEFISFYPDEIGPKLAFDIHYWAQEFNATDQQLPEAIRVHGNSA